MELNFENLSIKQEIDDFDEFYGYSDPLFKFVGVHEGRVIEHIRPTDLMREIRLGEDEWIKIIKLQEPIGMSTDEFRDEYTTNSQNVWQFGRPSQGFHQSTGHTNSNMIINWCNNTSYSFCIPIYYQRLLSYCNIVNPKFNGAQLRWYSSSSPHDGSLYTCPLINLNKDRTEDKYQITLGPVKSKIIVRASNAAEYHIQLEHNTLVIASKKLKYTQITDHPCHDRFVPIWLEFFNLSKINFLPIQTE